LPGHAERVAREAQERAGEDHACLMAAWCDRGKGRH
jgi:hypothetical protein